MAPETNVIKNLPIEGKDGSSQSLVTCGNWGEDICRLSDLIVLANRFSEFLIKIVLPLVFFVGLVLTAWPLVKSPYEGENSASVAEAKRRLRMLLIGISVVIGAFLIVKIVLISIGANAEQIFDRSVGKSSKSSYYTPIIFDKVYANVSSSSTINQNEYNENSQSFQNPLSFVSVQDVVRSIVNISIYIATLFVIYFLVKSGIYFTMSQEKPENLRKAKAYLLFGIGLGLVFFGASTFYDIIVNTLDEIFSN